MANHKSAEKRAKQSEKRRLDNRMRKGSMRTAIKVVLTAVETGDKEAATAALIAAQPLIDRSGARGVIHKSQASRRISRLAAKVKAIPA
ncbi:MAG: 30S ribosomal protein S20 [Mariprofundales bacterium]